MKKSFPLLVLLICLILAPVRVMADVSVKLILDRSEAEPGESVKMTIEVAGSRNSDSLPVFHGLEKFTIMKGGTSSRVQIINGKVSSSVDYTYFIQPHSTGSFKIGPAELKLDNKVLKSNIADLTVKKTSQKAVSGKSPLFIEAGLSSQNVFVEEQCIYTLKLYYRTRIRDVSLNLPEIENIDFKQLKEPVEYRKTYGGLDYQVLELRYAILPSREGDYVIGPSRMNMTLVETDRESPFRDFFKDPFSNDPFFSFSSGKPYSLAADSVELTVHSLPEKGRPADFSGLIGSFSMESSLEPSDLKAGESATLTVRVMGKGNVNRIPDLNIPEIDNAKLYADQPVFEARQDDRGFGGTKVMKWAIVPEKAGELKIPTLKLSFFDTEAEEYRVLKTSLHRLSVKPGERQMIVASSKSPEGGEAGNNILKREVKELGRDILPVHTDLKTLSRSRGVLMKGWIFWTALLFPCFIYMAVFFALKLSKSSPEMILQARSRKASKELIKKCGQDGLSFYHLAEAIRDYLNNRFNLSIGVLTADEAVRVLLLNGVSSETAEIARKTIQKTEDAVYTGKGQEITDLGKDLKYLVKMIEKEIP